MNTTYFLNQIVGNVFHTKSDPAIPATYYIGLSQTAPNEDGTGVTEPSTVGTSYARIAMSGMSEPSNGMITNLSGLTFPESTGSWGAITHYVVYDSATGGNLLFYAALKIARTVEAGSLLSIRAQELDINLGNCTITP